MFLGAQLVPFSRQALLRKYGDFAGYRDCVSQVVASLQRQGLYDSDVESSSETAERARALFGAVPAAASGGETAERARGK